MNNLNNKFSRRKPAVTRLPINLHKEILKLYEPDTLEYQYTIHFVTKILSHYMYNKLPFTEPKSIPKKYYDKVLSSCKHIWDPLKNAVFIMTSNYSTTKKESCKYVFKPSLVKGDWLVVTYYQSYQQYQGKIDSTKPLYKNVERTFKNTTIKYPKDTESIKEKYRQKIRKEITKNNMIYIPKINRDEIYVKNLDVFSEQLATLKLERNLIEVLKFKDQYWRANRNETNKRLDTNITNMSKDFRPGIKIDGQSLKQIDISNSQPCILANSLLYFKDHFLPVLNNHYESLDMQRILDQIPIHILEHPLCKGYDCIQIPTSNGGEAGAGFISPEVAGIINPLYLYLMMWGFRDIDSLNDLFNSPDFNLFCQHSMNGSLYEYMVNQLSLNDRDEAKISSYKFLFGYTQDENYKEVFPSISHLIYEFKKWLHKSEKILFMANKSKYLKSYGEFIWKSGQNKFSVLLQRIESDIVIDGIYIDLVKQYNCITVHDSFLYYQEKVKNIILPKLNELLPYGFRYKVS